MIRRPPRSTQSRSSAASDVYKRQVAVAAARRAVLEAEGEAVTRLRVEPRDHVAKRGRRVCNGVDPGCHRDVAGTQSGGRHNLQSSSTAEPRDTPAECRVWLHPELDPAA